jgi:hypothetical protein
MNLFYEQASMESFFGYPMAGGRATTLVGDGNNTRGGGSLPLGDGESEPYSVLSSSDEE